MMFRKTLTVGFVWLFVMGASAFAQTQVCIPQFLDGVAGPFQWRTTIVVQNQDQNQAQVHLQFYNSNGTPMQQFRMSQRGGQGPFYDVGANGQCDLAPVGARAAVGYQSGGQGSLQAGFVMLQTQNRIQAHAMLQLLDGSGRVISETIINPTAQFRTGSFYADRGDGAAIGLALANLSATQAATCTLDLVSQEGVVLGTTQLALAANSHTARFLFELFPNIPNDGVGFVRINSDIPICALALRLRDLAMTQIPVVIEN